MDLHDDTIDELSGVGTIIIGGEEAGAIYYWLTIVPVAGPVVAEGSITGPEEFMRKVMNATGPKLVLQDGHVVTLQCDGGATGVRWVKALADLWSDRTMHGSERCPPSPELRGPSLGPLRSRTELVNRTGKPSKMPTFRRTVFSHASTAGKDSKPSLDPHQNDLDTPHLPSLDL